MNLQASDDVQEELHREFQTVRASNELGDRLWKAGRAVDVALALRLRSRPAVPRIWRRPVFVAAAAAVAVVVVAVLVSIRPWSTSTPVTVAGQSADPLVACASPQTSFARFWSISSGDDTAKYQGAVRVGTATVPAMAMYMSAGAPGVGTMCVSGQAGQAPAVQAVARAQAGAIGYVGDVDSVVFFAVGPGVDHATVDYGAGAVKSYTLDGTGELQLQPLDDGWHAVSVGFGSPPGTVIVRAYDAQDSLLDTVSYTLKSTPFNGGSSSASSPATR